MRIERRYARNALIGATLALLVSSGALSGSARAETIARPSPQAYAVPSAQSFALATTGLPNGRRVVLRWNPCQIITYSLNVADVPVARRATVAKEVRAAVAKLAAASGMTFSYKGTTTTVPTTKNVGRQKFELVIAVANPRDTDFSIGKGVLGYGGYRYWQWTITNSSGRRTSNAAIGRGWVVIDAVSLMKLKAGFGSGGTRGNVILHELAHVAGLNHVKDARQLLNPTLLPASPNGYAPGDRTGLTKVGRRAGCIAVPSSVIRDLR